MSVILKEIAEQLGVSVSTVSRVLNGKDRVSAQTREKVKDALAKADYKPNDMARALRGKPSNAIGIVVGDISNDFFAKIVKGAENAAMQRGYTALVCNTDSEPDRVRESVRVLLSKRVSGIVMASVDFENAAMDQGTDTPIVYIDNLPENTDNYNSVSIDNELASRQLTEYLISRGHRRIAILAGSPLESSGRGRLAGWKAAMEANNLEMPDYWIAHGDFSLESGIRNMERILACKSRPTAILTANNSLAFGAMLALRRHGFNVPGDISLAAFDVNDDTQLIVPRLTTMNQPSQEFGRVAVELCLRCVRQKKADKKFEHLILRHDFIEGDSVINAT